MKFAQPNDKPGKCCKCGGTGIYKWGRRGRSGLCFACGGSGQQTRRQIRRNQNYNALAYRRGLFT
jgi:hypothetical protein